MIEMLAGIVTIVAGAYGFWRWLTRKKSSVHEGTKLPLEQPAPRNEVYALVERFVEIYRAHGIERTQIPRFLGEKSGLTLLDVSTDEKLLEALTEELLQITCEKFGIRREWLDGKDEPIYPYLSHNDNLLAYIDFLLELKETGAAIQGFAIKQPEDNLKKREGEHGDYDRYLIGLLFRVKLDHWGDHTQDSIWKYYPLGDQIYWGYERTRMQLKAKTLIAHMLGIYFKGCIMGEDEIEGLMEERIFPGPLMEHRSHVGWHPEDYIFTERESRAVADAEEALKVRDWYPHMGWREKLEEIVGSIEENTPFIDGVGNPRWHKRVDRMVF